MSFASDFTGFLAMWKDYMKIMTPAERSAFYRQMEIPRNMVQEQIKHGRFRTKNTNTTTNRKHARYD